MDPRAAAFRILRDVEEREGSVRAGVERACRGGRVAPADRALLREIAAGVTRQRLALDAVVDAFSDRSPDPVVRRALRIGLYQVLYLDRIPARAAVDTTVELVRTARKHATGFANAVLRAATRSLLARDELPGPHPRRALPVGRNVWAVFDRDILPDPDDEGPHLAVAHSHPLWLVERWLAAAGSERTLSRLRAGNRRPQTFLRVRPGRMEELRDALKAARCPVAPVSGHPDALRLEGERRVDTLPGFAEGWFVVQDVTSQGVAPMLEAGPGERILDVGAAPGGKAAHLADLTGDGARIVAVDVSPARLAHVRDTIGRLRLTSIRPVVADARHPGFLGGPPFDRALIDAPCSNTGVLRRRVEARWRLEPESLASLVARQADLLRATADLVRPGGVLVYGTCSLEEEENRGVVAAFLRERRDYRMDDERLAEPGAGDGGYGVRLRRLDRKRKG
jgi:16S rRNA (cytosine967-C5)-methyltransferase